MSGYRLNDVITVTVDRITNYGVFVSLEDGYKGLIHISEISYKFVSDINYFVKLNERMYAEIIGIDYENKRLSLSIKNINYKIKDIDNKNKIEETPHGFRTLRRNLPLWIKENLKKEKKIIKKEKSL